MMMWRQPRPNEANFLPWFQQLLLVQRRQRYTMLAMGLMVSLLLLASVGWQYARWWQAVSQSHDGLASGRLYLQQQQQRSWLTVRKTQQAQRNASVAQGLQHKAWLPALELATLVAKLSAPQQLTRWRWTQQKGQAAHIEFELNQLQDWPSWWQIWVQTRPKSTVLALNAQPNDVGLWVQYQLMHEPAAAMPDLDRHSLALRPDPMTHNLAAVAAEDMAQQLSHLSSSVELSTARESLQLKAQLPSAQWRTLAPVPSGVGWSLAELSLVAASSGLWDLAMSWQTDLLAQNLGDDNNSFSLAQQRAIGLAFDQFFGPPSMLASPHEKGVVPGLMWHFAGYSRQANKAVSVWLRQTDSGKVKRLTLGQTVGPWRLIGANAQQVTLQQGKHQRVLQRQCVTGVCP
ncbi:MAG TPA: hypothetical protein DE045_11190 [Oceanospirillaceae bacterium]|nr:hypothetical protein [Oceanospirillaceae bacterium]